MVSTAAILLAAFTMSQTIDRYLPISRSAHRLPVARLRVIFALMLYALATRMLAALW